MGILPEGMSAEGVFYKPKGDIKDMPEELKKHFIRSAVNEAAIAFKAALEEAGRHSGELYLMEAESRGMNVIIGKLKEVVERSIEYAMFELIKEKTRIIGLGSDEFHRILSSGILKRYGGKNG